MSAHLRAVKQPCRLPDGTVMVSYGVIAQCEHGGAIAHMSPSMFEDSRMRESVSRRLEQDLHQETGCACAAPIPPDVEIIECAEVSA